LKAFAEDNLTQFRATLRTMRRQSSASPCPLSVFNWTIGTAKRRNSLTNPKGFLQPLGFDKEPMQITDGGTDSTVVFTPGPASRYKWVAAGF